MHGLYRCKCRVAYRPFASDKLIVFDERQVANASINLNFTPNLVNLNMEGHSTLTEFQAALIGSTANVVLSDPYMTGVAWLALFDTAAAYSNSTAAAANYILLPVCGEGENAASGKCKPDPYKVIEDPNVFGTALGSFAHLVITLYYEVAGTTFSLETYFRLEGFQIEHGKSYPQVSLRGVEPQTVIFNQSLENFKLEENRTLEENLTDIVEKYDYNVSFCVPPDAKDSETPYIMPRSFKEKNVTAAEVIKKYVDSVGGSILTLPTKEYARKVSICTRMNTNQGCSVFYLGKGLYEGYTLSGGVDRNFLNQNLEYNQERALGYTYDSAPLDTGRQYKLEKMAEGHRKEKLRNAQKDKIIFQSQFSKYEKRYASKWSTSGYVWTATYGPEVTTERVQNTNIYGLGVNGTTPKALLDGKVLSVAPDAGRVLIGTNYFLRYCRRDDVTTCYNSGIYQESIGLKTIKDSIKKYSVVKIGDELGTATAEDPEFVRFYISGNLSGKEITLSPGVVWNHAIPVEKLTDEELKNIRLSKSNSPGPSDPRLPLPTGSGQAIGRVGNTGDSTGPHLHAEKFPPGKRSGRGVQITSADVDPYVSIGGTPASTWGVFSPYGQRSSGFHYGIDFSGPGPGGKNINNQSVTITGGATVIKVGRTDGYGNFVEISTPAGYDLLLAHLADGSTSNVKPGTRSSTGDGYGTGVQSGPAPIGASITTEFKGVPRALRIVPGRTVLSFITRYDEWVEKGRPADIDPGVWIAGRFSKYFITQANYNWAQGDLRVSLTGITDWGNTTAKILIPTFEDYVEAFRSTNEFKETNDYYGYIRSLGDLCWKLKDGKNSCEVLCEEAQQFQNYLRDSSGGSSGPSGVDSNFPASQCNYTGTAYQNKKKEIEQVMGALRTVGINTKEGYAGVIGNLIKESGLNANRHQMPNPGEGCKKSNKGSQFSELWPSAFGLAQWCGGRQDNVISSCGRNASFGCQLEFMLREIREKKDVYPRRKGDPSTLEQALNQSSSPEQAARYFNDYYERGDLSNREGIARDIYNGLSCRRIKS